MEAWVAASVPHAVPLRYWNREAAVRRQAAEPHLEDDGFHRAR